MGVLRSRSNNTVVFSGRDKEKIAYCQDCWKFDIFSPLRNRIYLDENDKITNPGPDAEKWKQCWTCGLIVGVYEAKPEVELETLAEPRNNPFKFKSGQVETGHLHASLKLSVKSLYELLSLSRLNSLAQAVLSATSSLVMLAGIQRYS